MTQNSVLVFLIHRVADPLLSIPIAKLRRSTSIQVEELLQTQLHANILQFFKRASALVGALH